MRQKILMTFALLLAIAQGAWGAIAVDGKLPGAFSVSATKQVWFSQGNLQYQANSTGAASAPYTGVWRFATNQYEAIGSGNSNVSASYDGWIDSFGWGSGNQPTQTSEASNVYSTFVDWGTNAISNGGNTANLWRTLSESEWTYLVFTRPNASSKRGRATINGMYCFVLLPDVWVLPSGLSFTPDANDWTNEYTTEQWIQMEDAGAVCFPAAGSRAGGTNNTNVNDYNRWCCYWSSTSANSSQGYNLWITSDHVGTTDKGNYQMGASVRLVSETMFPGSGTEEVPYLISSEAAWKYLADQVSAGNTYSGKYFQLTEDIGTEQEPITRMIGIFSSTESDCRPFSGTFDGNDHTLTVNYSSNDYETRTALFSYVKVATIRNLIVAGNCGTAGRAASIVGESDESDGLNTVTNCVSSVTISGGLVGGIALGGNVDIRGCLFNGTINGTSQSGGIVCWGKNVTKITNCLFAPQAGSSISGNTFYCTDGGAATVTNCYYTTALGTAQGKQARSISAGDDVTISNLGSASATYDVSGITAYSHGIKYNDIYYAGDGDAVSLNLSHADKAGYTFNQYTVTGGGSLGNPTTNTPTLTMTGANQTINATWTENTATLTDGDELSALLPYAGKTCTVTYTRSFTAGKPSTVCLPFAYTPKGEEKFYSFTGINEDDGNYTADMTEVVSPLVANTPYLFMPTGNADFSGTYAIPASIEAGTTTNGDWTFKGTYSTIEWADAPEDPTYGFSAQAANDGITQGQFVKVGSYVRIKPMRAYLQYNGSDSQFANARALMTRAAATTSDDTLPETIGVRLISANGEVTAIGTLYTRTGEVSFDSEAWYTLDGKRLNAKPNTKGIYVNNGKKVVIK